MLLETMHFVVEVRIEGYERFVVLGEDQADAEERALNCVQSGLPHAMKGRKLTVARIEKVKTADVLTLVGPA